MGTTQKCCILSWKNPGSNTQQKKGPVLLPTFHLTNHTSKIKNTFKPDIGIMVRVFAYGPGDLGSIPDWVIPKTLKMVLDASLLNTQHYKVRIKGKVEKSRERSSALGVVAIKKVAFGSPSTMVDNFTNLSVTAGEAMMNSIVMFFHGLLQMNVPVLANQQRLTSAWCRLEDLLVEIDNRDRWWERKSRNSCCQYDLMMLNGKLCLREFKVTAKLG